MPTPARSSGMWGAFGNAPIDVPPAARGGGGAARRRERRRRPWRRAGSRYRGPGLAAVRRTGARREGVERRSRLRGRPSESPRAGVHAGREVRHADVHQSDRARRPQSAAGLAFSPDAQQQFLYVADYGNSHIAVLDRKSLQILYQFGQRSEKPGDFQGLHHLAVDSKGNLYTGEVAPGARAPALRLQGTLEHAAAQCADAGATRRHAVAPPAAPAPDAGSEPGRARFRHRVRRAAAIRRGPARWPARTA